MKEYANVRIKELIQKHPRVLDVLEEFKLPCSNCSDNNCFVKDIAETENFSLKDEMKFITQMSKALSGQEE